MQLQSLSQGLWPVMLTPFSYNNKVDLKSLKELTEFYIQSGSSGLFANCLSSEMFQLTESERLQIVSTVVKIASKYKLNVAATGTFSTDMTESADFIKKVFDTGVAAVVIISNQLGHIEDDETVVKKNLEKLIKHTKNIPLGIYECPYPYKRLVSPSLIKWMEQTQVFYYMKDTSCNPLAIEKKVAAIKGTRFSLYNANTATALSSLEMGASGLSPIGANFYPELYKYMLDNYRKKEKKESLQKLNDRLNVMEGIASKCYPYSAKQFLQSRKLNLTTQCRIQHENMRTEDYINLKSLEAMRCSVMEEFDIKSQK